MAHKGVFDRAFLSVCKGNVVEPFDETDAGICWQRFYDLGVLMGARSVFGQVFGIAQD